MAGESSNGKAVNGVTEDEAALYDRQIRLWGLEAQGRIRNAHILVLNLDGLTTEAIKNWVLAGIHRLTIVDFRETTQAHDLSAGFFWREEDVGEDRLSTAAVRIQALNPLVQIDVLPSSSVKSIFDESDDTLGRLRADVMVVGLPSVSEEDDSKLWTRRSLVSLNRRARDLGIKFYCSAMYGFDGWIFSDLGEAHEYVIEKPAAINASPAASAAEGPSASPSAPPSKDEGARQNTSKRLEKRSQTFVPLDTALVMSWKGLSRAQLRRQKPSIGLFCAWSAWSLSDRTEGSGTPTADQLSRMTKDLFLEHGVQPTTVLPANEEDQSAIFDALQAGLSLPGQFSPSCAIVGGVLSQDVLNAIGGREEPLVNWFQLDGLTGSGVVHALSIPPTSISTS